MYGPLTGLDYTEQWPPSTCVQPTMSIETGYFNVPKCSISSQQPIFLVHTLYGDHIGALHSVCIIYKRSKNAVIFQIFALYFFTHGRARKYKFLSFKTREKLFLRPNFFYASTSGHFAHCAVNKSNDTAVNFLFFLRLLIKNSK